MGSLPLARFIQDLISCMMAVKWWLVTCLVAAMVLVTSATPDSPAESKEAGEYRASDIQEVANIRQQREANKGKAKKGSNKRKGKKGKAKKESSKRKGNKGKGKPTKSRRKGKKRTPNKRKGNKGKGKSKISKRKG